MLINLRIEDTKFLFQEGSYCAENDHLLGNGSVNAA
jgi:hypothetical protein